jgi:hypothetical protein
MTNIIVQLLPFYIWLIVSLFPALSICKRVGKTRWWAAPVVFPPLIGLIIFLLILAYSRWIVTPTVNLEVRPIQV